MAGNFAGRVIGDGDEALRQARLAQEIGERLATPAIHAYALQIQGYALVGMGHVADGLALIDESTVAAVSGKLDPLTTGRIYCSTISVCRDLADWRRAIEWTDATERWCRLQRVSGFPGICRVHRAEIMQLRGSWADAEREARRACEELNGYDLLFSAEAHYEIGEVRLRVGDLDGAEEAFRQAGALSREPEPGRSLLRLPRGMLKEPTPPSSGRSLPSNRIRPLKRDCSPLPSRSGSPLEISSPLPSTSYSSRR
jgi:tetratricopeptide (TPR) repeat protein